MYHILPPQSQAQFGIGERPDNKGNMAPCPRSGLKFAPSIPGNEPAYQVTHDAFVRYARIASGSQGFQTLSSPIVTSGAKN